MGMGIHPKDKLFHVPLFIIHFQNKLRKFSLNRQPLQLAAGVELRDFKGFHEMTAIDDYF
jgi:hypothetical protein